MKIPKDKLLPRYEVENAPVGKSSKLMKRVLVCVIVALVVSGYILIGLW